MLRPRFQPRLIKRKQIYDDQTLRSDGDHLSKKFTVLDAHIQVSGPSAETEGAGFMTCAGR